jgi:predicted cobalt transporter CbtA
MTDKRSGAMSSEWQRVSEPLGRTLRRTIGIALVIGAVFAFRTHEVRTLLPMTLVALWPSLGGHYVELAFLNGLRPLLPHHRAVQVGARLLVWLVAGVILYLLMAWSARALSLRGLPWQWCWVGAPAFVVVELLAHVGLALRRLPNFYDGRA